MLLIERKSIWSKLPISNYYVRVVYKVVNDESPPELSNWLSMMARVWKVYMSNPMNKINQSKLNE